MKMFPSSLWKLKPSMLLTLSVYLSLVVLKRASGYEYKTRYIESLEVCTQHTKRQVPMAEGDDNYGLIMRLTRYGTIAPQLQGLRCRFEVKAPRGFGLFVIIRKMDFRQDYVTGECIDSITFQQDRGNKTAEICGKQIHRLRLENPLLERVVPEKVNMYHDPAGEMTVTIKFGPSKENRATDIELVFTAYRECTNIGVFKMWRQCPGLRHLCIHDNMICDEYINCGKGDLNDESGCDNGLNGNSSQHLDDTLLPVYVTGGVLFVGFIFVLWCVFGRRQCKGLCSNTQRRQEPRTQRTTRFSAAPSMDTAINPEDILLDQPSAPPHFIMPDCTSSLAPTPSGEDYPMCKPEDPPPSYDSLFPEEVAVSRSQT